MQTSERRGGGWIRWLGGAIVLFVLAGIATALLLGRADGPVGVLAGGPFRSGEQVELSALDWTALDGLLELELEIVAAKTSLTLWFSVDGGIPYVACDLDCMDGRLTRWPQQLERDDRVVVRIDGRRALGRLVHVPHGSEEYLRVRAGRDRKYSAVRGERASAERAVHDTVVELGESLTGRASRAEPGDRLYRLEAR